MSLSLLAGKTPARKELYYPKRLSRVGCVLPCDGTGSKEKQIQIAQTWDSALHLHLNHESDDLLQVGRRLYPSNLWAEGWI